MLSCLIFCMQPVAHALLDACTREMLLLLAAAPAAAVVPAVLQLQLPAMLQQHTACKTQLQQLVAGAGCNMLCFGA
jgi:hypothetical protein